VELAKLTAFATLASPVPRLVEFGWGFINSELTKTKASGKPLQCDDYFFVRMLDHIEAEINDRYDDDVFAVPSAEALYHIIYGDRVDSMITNELVRASILTNEIFSDGCFNNIISMRSTTHLCNGYLILYFQIFKFNIYGH